MATAAVVTPWAGDGQSAATAFGPKIAQDYVLTKWRDVTGQANIIPTPNLYVVEIACADAVLATLQADPNYLVLWSQ